MTLFRTVSHRSGLCLAASLLLATALSAPVLAQERTPAERQTLVDLAYAIGESHALRQACNGAGDQFWRDRMVQLNETEIPEADFDARMKQAFNSGFASRQAQFPTCSQESRKAELAVARKGEALSTKLAATTRQVKRMGPDAPESEEGDPVSIERPAKPR